MEAFYPILKRIKTNEQYTWELLDVLNDDGDSAIIYDISGTRDPLEDGKYVLKYMEFGKYDKTTYDIVVEQVIKEVTNQDLCFSLGIAPEIIEAWICEKGAVIIMRKLDLTLCDLLSEYKSFLVRYLIVSTVLLMIDKMHKHGVYHHDPHLGNFMVKSMIANATNVTDVKSNDEYKRYRSKNYKYCIIDFGSSELEKPTVEIIKDDYIIFATSLKPFFSFKELVRIFKPSGKLTRQELKRIFRV